MRGIKVVKAHIVLVDSLQSPQDLSVDDDRAVAEFRAFHQVGHLHASRVNNGLARNEMLEIVEDIKNTLINKVL